MRQVWQKSTHITPTALLVNIRATCMFYMDTMSSWITDLSQHEEMIEWMLHTQSYCLHSAENFTIYRHFMGDNKCYL